MTHREKLAAQLRRLWIAPLLGIVTVFISAAIASYAKTIGPVFGGLPLFAAGMFGGMALFAAGMVFLQWGLRCLRCRGRLAHVIMSGPGGPLPLLEARPLLPLLRPRSRLAAGLGAVTVGRRVR